MACILNQTVLVRNLQHCKKYQKRASKIKVACVVNEEVEPESTPVNSIISYPNFAEKLNGRCAMQGFMWGSAHRILEGKSVANQIVELNATNGHYEINDNNVLAFVSIVALITLGTAITEINNDNDLYKNSLKYQPEKFTSEAELLNGRLAMMGFLILTLL